MTTKVLCMISEGLCAVSEKYMGNICVSLISELVNRFQMSVTKE